MRLVFYYTFCFYLLFTLQVKAQNRLSFNQGHSHNDYHQLKPLLIAYGAGMGSIEADIFMRHGQLFVAHDTVDIQIGATLKNLYLEHLASFYAKSGNRAYPDSSMNLQLVIDIKENHQQVLPLLIEELETYQDIFNSKKNKNAIRILISGDVPLPAQFKNYPDYIFFDGRPTVKYTKAQLKRIAMISADLKKVSSWKGIGNPSETDMGKLKAVIASAHRQRKPFRFWATPDSPNTWTVLEGLGVDWINTDHPESLRKFYINTSN